MELKFGVIKRGVIARNILLDLIDGRDNFELRRKKKDGIGQRIMRTKRKLRGGL